MKDPQALARDAVGLVRPIRESLAAHHDALRGELTEFVARRRAELGD
jgi:hypothetical protein